MQAGTCHLPSRVSHPHRPRPTERQPSRDPTPLPVSLPCTAGPRATPPPSWWVPRRSRSWARRGSPRPPTTAFAIATVSGAGTQLYAPRCEPHRAAVASPAGSAATVDRHGSSRRPPRRDARPDSTDPAINDRGTVDGAIHGEMDRAAHRSTRSLRGRTQAAAECDFALMSSDSEALVCFTGLDGSEIHASVLRAIRGHRWWDASTRRGPGSRYTAFKPQLLRASISSLAPELWAWRRA